jgi:hypothetical protein
VFVALALALRPASADVPFHLGTDIAPGSALDVSFLLDKPAGQHGTVRAEGERLVFGNGMPAAFWGVNLCWDALYPPEKEALPVARRLAMSGCNLVRLTYLDGGPHGLFRQDRPDSGTLDEQRLARLDRLMAECKKAGVYSLMVLGMGRTVLKQGDGAPAYDDPETARAAYAIGRFFDERVQRADQKVWRALLDHVNPHTRLRWADDPAVAAVEILNEGSLFYRYDQFAKVPAPLRARIQIRWNRWLAARYGVDRTALERHWGAAGLRADENPARGTVGLDFSLLASASPRPGAAARAADWNRFLAEVCRAYYEEQIRFLRGLGVKQPISCNGGGSFSAADKWSNRVGDLFDQHTYHDHPNWTPYLTYTNRSALKGGLGIVQSLSRGRLGGMPYGVSEYDFCYPNDWRAEGWAPMAAYGRLQGWSFLTAFAYWSGSWEDRASLYGPEAGIKGVWRFHNDPAVFGQWPLTALIFLRGDVRPSQRIVDIGFSDADTFAAEQARFPSDRLRSLEGVALVHRTRQVPSGKADISHAKSNPPLSVDGWMVSDTGELRYRADPGIFVIDTPRTQGIAGFAKGMRLDTRSLQVTLESDFGTVMLSSLDGKPLGASRRMLLTAVGRCQNTGFVLQQDAPARYRANGDSLGRGPILIEPVRFTLNLRADRPGELQAFGLDGSGNRMTSLPLEQHGSTVRLHAGNGPAPATIYYELVRQRATKERQ